MVNDRQNVNRMAYKSLPKRAEDARTPAANVGHPLEGKAPSPRPARQLAARLSWWLLPPCLWAAGCGHWTIPQLGSHIVLHHPVHPPMAIQAPGAAVYNNPLFVPATDIDFLWDQVVDAIDDFFKISREERLRLTGNVLTEGRLETFPTIGATYLEPWKRDSTPGFERWQSTFQTIRRTATARVTPAKGGYLIEVIVAKEIEDLYQPEQSTVGGATLRHDGSLVRTDVRGPRSPTVLGWIPLGRDTALEQRILADIQARLAIEPMPSATSP